MINVIIGAYIFVLGSIFASFFGVIIDRVPVEKSIISPKSKCDNCGHELKWYENIPIFSYIFLGGKCSKCKCKINKFLFIYEIIGGLSLLLVFIKYGLTVECIIIELIVLMMLLIAGYDYKTNLILDVFLYILAFLNICLFCYRVFILKYYWLNYVISALIGLLFFGIIKIVMSKILNKDALGTGDIYLVTIMGLSFIPIKHLLAISIASLVGSIFAIILIKLSKKQREAEIAFCPYLCLGYYIIFIFGEYLLKLLLR